MADVVMTPALESVVTRAAALDEILQAVLWRFQHADPEGFNRLISDFERLIDNPDTPADETAALVELLEDMANRQSDSVSD